MRLPAPALLAEDFAEDVERIVEAATTRATARTGAAALLESRVTVAIVRRALLRIFEDFVGLGDFFKHLLRLLVTLIFVRVVLDGLLAIGLLEVVFGGAFFNAEQLVVIFLGHGRGLLDEARTLINRAGPAETA